MRGGSNVLPIGAWYCSDISDPEVFPPPCKIKRVTTVFMLVHKVVLLICRCRVCWLPESDKRRQPATLSWVMQNIVLGGCQAVPTDRRAPLCCGADCIQFACLLRACERLCVSVTVVHTTVHRARMVVIVVGSCMQRPVRVHPKCCRY